MLISTIGLFAVFSYIFSKRLFLKLEKFHLLLVQKGYKFNLGDNERDFLEHHITEEAVALMEATDLIHEAP